MLLNKVVNIILLFSTIEYSKSELLSCKVKFRLINSPPFALNLVNENEIPFEPNLNISLVDANRDGDFNDYGFLKDYSGDKNDYVV
ncbi:MAG: hypothetical protein ABIO44_06870, partial [Saprospiraceae bacterium]